MKNTHPQLRNKLSKDQALARLSQESFSRTTLSFYRYTPIADPHRFRDQLFKEWSTLGVLGRIYIAHEGINAQINVPEPRMDDFRRGLDTHLELARMYLNIAVEHGASFYKLKIKVREQIVASNLPLDSYDLANSGTYLDAGSFNSASQDPNAIIVDMRNHYESRVGKFEGALTPNSDFFRDEVKEARTMLEGKQDKKILLYCTGGIRCTPFSAYLKHQGFKDVNQLRGGIVSYAQEVRAKGLQSKFKGKNFTFDERLGERITQDIIARCDQCDKPCDEYTNCVHKPCNLLFIQCVACKKKFDGVCSIECQQ